MATVRAKYTNGVLTPLEPLDLEEGKEVTLSIDKSESPKSWAYGTKGQPKGAAHESPSPDAQTTDASTSDETKPPLTGFAAILASARELHETMPPEEQDRAPRDLAKNLKHYLYGHPKEEDE